MQQAELIALKVQNLIEAVIFDAHTRDSNSRAVVVAAKKELVEALRDDA